jgi:hypothetical protein
MPPQTPLLLVDNVFDTVNQYPTGHRDGERANAGHEGFRVADYRRERTELAGRDYAREQQRHGRPGRGVTGPSIACSSIAGTTSGAKPSSLRATMGQAAARSATVGPSPRSARWAAIPTPPSA